MKELIIGIIVLAIGGITTFANKHPKSYSNFLAPILFYVITTSFISYSTYLIGKDDFGPFYGYVMIGYMVFILWLRALYDLHKLKD